MKRTISLCLLAVSLSASAQTHVLDINTKKIGAPRTVNDVWSVFRGHQLRCRWWPVW